MARLSALHGVIPSVVYPIVLRTDSGPDMLCSPCSEHSGKYTIVVDYFFSNVSIICVFELLGVNVCACVPV